MERFLQRARDMVPLSDVFVVPLPGPGAYRLRVLLGQFETRELALDAAKRLPPKYQRVFNAAPRSFAELRDAL